MIEFGSAFIQGGASAMIFNTTIYKKILHARHERIKSKTA